MHVSVPSISEHRLKRLHRWALLWLRWFAAFLDAAEAAAPFSQQAIAIAHRWLDHIERSVVAIVLTRAAPHVRTIAAPRHAARPRLETHLERAVIGARLRRALRPRDLRQRIAALSQDIDALIARVLKRLPRGLTRRRPIRARCENRVLTREPVAASAAFAADTS